MATDPNEPDPATNEATAGQSGEGLPAEAAAPQKSGGGLAAWLPLIATCVAMPALAYLTTAFVLLPKVQKSLANSLAASATPSGTNALQTSRSTEKIAVVKPTKGKEGAESKVVVPINKILVNLAGSMGTRYLLTSLSLVGEGAEFKDQIDKSQAQIVDLAAGVLAGKTIADLEKPGARNVVRNELLTVFNNTLGQGVVKEIYITEFAIQ